MHTYSFVKLSKTLLHGHASSLYVHVNLSLFVCWLILITFWCCSSFGVSGQCARKPGIISLLHSLLYVSLALFFLLWLIRLRLPEGKRIGSLTVSVCLLFWVSLQHFKLLVEELHVKGEGKVKKAMKESFRILNEVCLSLPQSQQLLPLGRNNSEAKLFRNSYLHNTQSLSADF